MDPVRALIPFVPYALISAIHVVLRFLEHPLDYPTKLMLMPALALAALGATASIRPYPRGPVLLLLAAVFFSWLGDGAGFFFPGLPELPMMLASFGLAHVAYVLMVWKVPGIARGGFPLWASVYLLAYAVLMVLLWPHAGVLRVPVMIYGVLLAATAAFAARCGAVIAWGGAWFLVSDAILSFRIFIPEIMPDWTSAAVMLTYTLGQGLIVYGVTRALQQRSVTPDPVTEGVAAASAPRG